VARARVVSAPVRAAWLAAHALLLFLAFPHPVGQRVVDLGVPLGFLAPAAFWLGLRGLPWRRAAWVGFAAGLAANSLVLHWIYVVTVSYGHAFAPLGVVAVVALASYIALFYGALGGASAALEPATRGLAGPLVLAALWTAVDWLRSFVLTGFPWATLGYAVHGDAWLRALAPWAGVYALSFAAALAGASLAAAHARRWRAAALGAAAFAALHGAGALSAASPPRTAGTISVAALQGNIDQGAKWSPEWAERTLAIYEDLTRDAAGRGAKLVVWPETAVPGSPDADASLRDRLDALARSAGVTLVIGAVGLDGYDPSRRTRADVRYFDSAYVLDPQRGPIDRYDKTHLVPFGEYVPLRALLGRFFSAVARGIANADVTAGAAPRSVALPDLPEPGGELPVGIPICYELLFPDLMRRFAGDGARALLAITNDAWYGRTGAPYQFLVMTALRAAESGLGVARAANTGVSALIDGEGNVRAQTRIFERSLVVGELALAAPDAPPTFYVRYGDWLPMLCAAAAAAAGAFALRAGRRGAQA
jgi:apolipoprotein N-acyltransferase